MFFYKFFKDYINTGNITGGGNAIKKANLISDCGKFLSMLKNLRFLTIRKYYGWWKCN